MIKIMDRYIARESLTGMFTWVGAVTIVMLVGILFELADFFVNKQVPLLITLEILLLYIPAQMVLTFPISYLLASELHLGRLGRESEMVAIEACGVSLKRILLPYLIVSILVSIGSYCFNDIIVPESNHKAQVLMREYVYKKGPPKIQQNVFFRDAGEPHGTAGRPILGSILTRNLTNLLVVVTRYFGGKKLGVRGLINAYQQAAEMVLENSGIIEMELLAEFILTVNPTCFQLMVNQLIYFCRGKKYLDLNPNLGEIRFRVPLNRLNKTLDFLELKKKEECLLNWESRNVQ